MQFQPTNYHSLLENAAGGEQVDMLTDKRIGYLCVTLKLELTVRVFCRSDWDSIRQVLQVLVTNSYSQSCKVSNYTNQPKQ